MKTTSSDVRNALYEIMTSDLTNKEDLRAAQQKIKAASGINQSTRFDLEAKRIALKAKRFIVKAIEI